jgi:hypothetical protein
MIPLLHWTAGLLSQLLDVVWEEANGSARNDQDAVGRRYGRDGNENDDGNVHV